MPKRSSTAAGAARQPQPKRVKPSGKEEDASQTIQIPSAKRGRPRKTSMAADEIQSSASKKQDLPVKVKDVVETPTATPSSRKRGRPSKVSSDGPTKDLDTPAKKRGRPSLNISAAQPSSAKKPGRPSKTAPTTTTTTTTTSDAATTATTATTSTTSPSKRGRPPKNAAGGQANEVETKQNTKSSAASKPGAAKRGRPPKKNAVVIASTAKSGSRCAKSSPRKVSSPKKHQQNIAEK